MVQSGGGNDFRLKLAGLNKSGDLSTVERRLSTLGILKWKNAEKADRYPRFGAFFVGKKRLQGGERAGTFVACKSVVNNTLN